MSAFVGIVQFDGCSVEPELVKSLTAYLAQIGPDGQRSYSHKNFGFGHALLKTTPESHNELQPMEFDGGSIILGDVRLDGRSELIEKLCNDNQGNLEALPDVELLLLAWRKWGRELTDHILGDFSFAVWDHSSQELFAVRDPFGIKTFYYHTTTERLVFSNALNAILRLPGFDRELNPQAVADFLLFQVNTDSSTTSFRQVQQIPPAHHARFRAGRCAFERYWSIPDEAPLNYKADHEYLEHFDQVFTQAVTDRLRCQSTNILVSAGMDSTSITAKAKSHFAALGQAGRIHLTTARASQDLKESEHPMVMGFANELELELDIIDPVLDSFFKPTDKSHWPAPEVFWHQAMRINSGFYASLAAKSPVALSGQGGDAVLKKGYSHMSRLAKQGHWLAWVKEFVAYRRMHGHRPPLGIQALVRKRYQMQDAPRVPKWINPDFAREQHMLERLQLRMESRRELPLQSHSGRPEAHQLLVSPFWQFVLPGHDSQATGQPLEFRHPFFDLRLVRYLMRVTSPRWFHQKALLRKAMAGELPTSITERPKHVFRKNPLKQDLLKLESSEWRSRYAPVQQLNAFVDWKEYVNLTNQVQFLSSDELELLMAPIYLAHWRIDVN